MKKLISLCLIILIVLTGCSSENRDQNSTYYVTITVQALDVTTGLAIAEAVSVIENGPVGKNASDGMTIFTNVLGNKEYTFVTSANTYNINRKTVKIGSSNTTITVSLNKLLGSITGFIVDETEVPISADIRLIELNRTTTSNATTGEFSFTDIPVIDDPYSLSITKTGYNERIINNLKLSAANLTASAGKITLGNTPGVLSGRVTDVSSRAVQYAEVRIPETNQSTSTDFNGDYTLQIFPGSNYTAEFTHADYSPFVKTGIVIRPNQTTVLNASLPVKGGSIFGVVRNSLDEPVPGALISVIGTSASGLSAIDGSFRINNVQPGTYTVTVTHDLYSSSSANAIVNSNQETSVGNIIMANKTGIIKGYLSQPNCTVILTNTLASQAYIVPSNFSFNNIMPGTYILKVERPDYVSVYKSVTVNSSQTIDVGTMNASTYQTGAPFGSETSSANISCSAVGEYDWDSESSWYNTITDSKNFSLNYSQTITYSYSNAISKNYGFVLIDSTKFYDGTKSGSMSLVKGNHNIKATSGDDYTVSINAHYNIDIKYPKINFSKTFGSGSSSYQVTINAIDVSLQSLSYVFTPSNSYPDNSYEFAPCSNNSTVTLNSEGTWYLHVKATDEPGNVGYRCEGPFVIK